jgi:hypothetical protein
VSGGRRDSGRLLYEMRKSRRLIGRWSHGSGHGRAAEGNGAGRTEGAAIGVVGGYMVGKVSASERERGSYEGQSGAGGHEYAPPSYVPVPSPYPYQRHRRSIPYGNIQGRQDMF